MEVTIATLQAPTPRGTRLAAELDRRLKGDEPLTSVILWWHEQWQADAEIIRCMNLSDNEIAVLGLLIIDGYRADPCPDEAANLQWFWSKMGLDSREALDDTYAAYIKQESVATLKLAQQPPSQQWRPAMTDIPATTTRKGSPAAELDARLAGTAWFCWKAGYCGPTVLTRI